MKPNIRSDIDRAIAGSEEARDQSELERLVCRFGSQEPGDRVVAAVEIDGPGAHARNAWPEERRQQEVGASKKWQSAPKASPACLGDCR
jgi:hypothetical protein